EELPLEERLQIGAYAARLQVGWTRDSKVAMARLYEEARSVEGGYSVGAYVEQFARDFFANLSPAEEIHLLSQGEHWPATALSVVASLPEVPHAKTLEAIRTLDSRIRPLCAEDNAQRRLRVGIVALLGRVEDEASGERLRSIYREEPENRDPVAMSMSQQPDGENWPYLVDALRILENPAAEEVIIQLATVPQRPKGADAYRHLILQGLRSQNPEPAIRLLERWAGKSAGQSGDLESQLVAWQSWYAQTFPNEAPAELPKDVGHDKWSYEELLTYLDSTAGKKGDVGRGERIFTKAQCILCHRIGGRGESIGPDLTSVAQRFQRKEILESIVYPDHVISDQYASRTVTVNGRTFTGMVAPRGKNQLVVLLPTGRKIEVARRDVSHVSASNASAMPTGLLNPLALEEVADLFAYLSAPTTTGVARRSTADQR
ncbi:c-type cytochrome, partial [Pirellulales bacterium]|nr:c-type cytochrome [Pirellulales bacterium]